MAVFVRTKRVTDPLNDNVKACLCGKDHRLTGCESSGSEHEADASVFLADLVHGFLEESDERTPTQDREDSETDESDLDPTDTLQAILDATTDRFRSELLKRVSDAVDAFASARLNPPALRRALMASLRDSGYNAGLCKTKWESSGGIAGGSYEFIDVVRRKGDAWQRYVVDLDFGAEFEIARPTASYERVLRSLPQVFVGRTEDLRRIVRIVADAAKRSLKNRGLHLPPWRRCRYMQTKWLGPYKRTFGQIPATASICPENFPAKCRSIGFEAGACRIVLPPATRTR